MLGVWEEKETLFMIDRLTDFTPKTNIKGSINKEYIRRMTPREWARIQGFPDDFRIPVSDTQSYRQFGNSVSVPVINAIAKSMFKALDE